MGTTKRLATLVAAITTVIGGQAAHAGDIRWNGFLNAGFGITDSGTHYAHYFDDKGDFGDTGLGLNASADIGRGLSVAGQLFTHQEEDGVTADWMFASYRFNDNVTLRAGKIKYPGNLVSEFVDVGYAYPWVRPPQEIYGHNEGGAVMTLESISGASAEYLVAGDDYELLGMVYAGEADEEEMDHQKLTGVKLQASSDTWQVLAGYSRSLIATTDDLAEPLSVMDDKWMEIYTVGGKAEWGNVVSYAEWVHSSTENVDDLTTDGGYLTFGYRIDKVMPLITYSFLDQDSGSGQTAVALGLRYDVTPGAALKAEWQRISPDAARPTAIPLVSDEPSSGLFEGLPSEDPVNFVSLMLNVSF